MLFQDLFCDLLLKEGRNDKMFTLEVVSIFQSVLMIIFSLGLVILSVAGYRKYRNDIFFLTSFVMGVNPRLLRRSPMEEYPDFEAQAFMPGRMSHPFLCCLFHKKKFFLNFTIFSKEIMTVIEPTLNCFDLQILQILFIDIHKG